MVDLQESKNASPIYRFAAGAVRGVQLLWDLLDPTAGSNHNAEPTKLQVVFAGLGRTGTTSLQKAMEILGYHCIHDDTAFRVTDLVDQHYHQKTITKDEMLQGYGERGFNCSFMFQDYDWAATQDDVKVVLSDRDAEKWADSWLAVVDGYDIMHARPFIWMESIRIWNALSDVQFRDLPTGGHPELYMDRDQLVKGYEIHKQNVIHAVPADRLLVYSVKQGWGPLCDFLGVDPPPASVPFPHVNDRLKMGAALWVMRVMTYTWPLAVVVPIWVLWRLFRRAFPTRKKQKVN